MNRFEILKNPDAKPCFAPVLPKVKKPKPRRTPLLDRQAIISRALNSAEGRQRLAESMAQPLRNCRNYTSLARRAFLVEPMPEGALPVFDRTRLQGLTGIYL